MKWEGSTKIQIKVKPRSKTEEIIEDENSLIVRVKDPPIEGKANRAVIRLMAKHFGVPENRVRISKGFKSKDKVIELLPVAGGTQNEKGR
ncbi:MAG: DUF167 domain-containing protein [Chloroflexi bacterium]|nr:DUF167 domain-containing protein [Chloroflexota bacterium]